MSMVIKDSKKKLTPEDIESFEGTNTTLLPDNYKIFLQNNNGGRPEPGGFNIRYQDGRIERGSVHYFLSIYDGDYSNLGGYIKAYFGRIPAGLLPIAYDDLGNLILLKCVDHESGAVLFWDHDQEGDNNYRPETAELGCIAETLEDFLVGLHELDD